VVERTKITTLIPSLAVFKDDIHRSRRSAKIVDIAAGSDTSFALDEHNNLWSFGLNNYGQTGHVDNAGESNAMVSWPKRVTAIEKDGQPQELTMLAAGNGHTTAVTKAGEALVWGRCDGGQMGITRTSLNPRHVMTTLFKTAEQIQQETGQPADVNTYKILTTPTPVPTLEKKAVFAAAGSDHTIFIDKDGRAYSTGFNSTYQCGQGHDRDIYTATMIQNTATKEEKLVWAGAGGQYSVFASYKTDADGDTGML
jgi:regulator of chromosome condensation